LFVVIGGMKLVMPAEELSAGSPFTETFMRFIGTCEVLGAFGLIVPVVLPSAAGNWSRCTIAGPLTIIGLPGR
jgi:hypothetical protein